MPVVPALDFRPAIDKALKAPPANIEAEQALLGALLYTNEAFHRFEGLKPSHFYEPFHGRLFERIAELIHAGKLAEPILLHERFANDPAYQELGEVRFLADLVDRAPPAANAPDYAAEIIDCAQRRELYRICGEALVSLDHERHLSGADHIGALEQELFALGETKQARGFRPFDDYLTGAVEMAAEAYQRDGGLSGISTGLIDLDQRTGGLHKSDLIIVAGRPGMGKTSLATNIAFNVAKSYAYQPMPDGGRKTTAGGVVAFFSLEMSGEQLAMRILGEVSGVSSDRIRRGDIEAHEFGHIRDAATLIQSIPLHIDASAGMTVGQMAARARRLKRTVGLDLVVVDYLQLAHGMKQYQGGQRTQEVSEITQGLKEMAKDLDVPVIALSQLSRQVESRDDKKPQLSDLRESGSIEQDADMVMFVYREEYYLNQAEPKADSPEYLRWIEQMDACRGIAELIIGKQRHGPTGVVRLHFNSELTRFGNLTRRGSFDYGAAALPYKDEP